MPIFEYRCRGCHRSFERIVLGAAQEADAIECPRCGGTGAERLVSRFATAAKSGSDDFGGDDMDFGGDDLDAGGGGGGMEGGYGGPAGGEEDEFGGADEDTDEAFGSEDGEDDD